MNGENLEKKVKTYHDIKQELIKEITNKKKKEETDKKNYEATRRKELDNLKNNFKKFLDEYKNEEKAKSAYIKEIVKHEKETEKCLKEYDEKISGLNHIIVLLYDIGLYAEKDEEEVLNFEKFKAAKQKIENEYEITIEETEKQDRKDEKNLDKAIDKDDINPFKNIGDLAKEIKEYIDEYLGSTEEDKENYKNQVDRIVAGTINDKTRKKETTINETKQYMEPKSTDETLGKIKDIEYYEQKVREGQFERLTKKIETKPTFFTKKGFAPTKAIVTGKKILEKMAAIEKRIDAIQRTMYIIDDKQKYSNTLEALRAMLNTCEKFLVTQKEKLKETDIDLISDAVTKERDKERKKKAIQDYAALYARYLAIMHDPDKKAEAYELETLLNEKEAEFKFDDTDLFLAKQAGRDIDHDKKMGEQFKENEALEAKRKEEDRIIEEQKVIEKIREEVVRRGVKVAPVLKGDGDVDLVATDKLEQAAIDEEVNRRSREYKQGKLVEELGSKGNDSNMDSVNFEELLKQATENLDQAVADKVEESFKYSGGFTTPAMIEEAIEYYKGTAGMTREERALESLKREGRKNNIFENVTMDTINLDIPIFADPLKVQMRQEAAVSDALEKFLLAKKNYENAKKAAQDLKFGDNIDPNDFSK